MAFTPIDPYDLIATRYAAGAMDGTSGMWVEGSSSTVNLVAEVQTVKGKELERLQQGEKNREFKRLLSSTELKTADRNTKTSADRVVIEGNTFEIKESAYHDDKVEPKELDHWTMYAVRLDNDNK